MRIVFILATGHSGSTVLGSVLGSASKTFHVGEFVNFYKVYKGILETCSCKNSLETCLFWKKVIDEFEKYLLAESLSIEDYESTRYRVESTILKNNSKPEEILLYAKLTQKLYSIIASHSGAEVIVDSSKSPSRAMAFRKVFGDNLSFVILRRKFHDVVQSYLRKRENLSVFCFMRSLFKAEVKFIYVAIKSKVNTHKFYYDSLFVDKRLKGLFDDLSLQIVLEERQLFYNKHVIAGNRMRYKEFFILDKSQSTVKKLKIIDMLAISFFEGLRRFI